MVATNGNKKITSDQIGEISSVSRDYPAGFASYSRYFLNREDGRILARGKGQKLSDIYRDTEKDAEVRQGLAQRYGAALARETVVEPASQSRLDKKVADEVRSQINNLNRRKPQLRNSKNAVYSFGDFDFFTRGMLDAIYMDYAVAEIDWAIEGERVVARQIWNRDQSRFIFDIADGGYELRLLTLESMLEGIALPPRKFLVHSVGSFDGCPYGGGLAEVLFWWVWFKRQELRFWLVFSDKYGSPTLKAQYETEAQKAKLLEIMRNVSQQAGVALPKGATLELLSAAISHTSTYKELCAYCDEQITSAILLQNLTTDVSGGSYAASETHFEVLSELVDSDTSALTSGPFNDLASWICEFNFGIDATPPLIYKPRVRVADEARARRDTALVALVGRPLTEQYLQTHYDAEFVSEEELAEKEAAQAAKEAELAAQNPPAEDPNAEQPFVFAESKIRVGTTVSWKYGTGTATGKVVKVYRDRITLKLGDSEITRNGSKDDPAVLIKQEDGAKVLKLVSEVKISTSDYAETEALDFKTAPSPAKKQKNCTTKGIPCKGQCISANKKCRTEVTGEAAKAADYLDAKVPKSIAQKSKTSPKAEPKTLAQSGTTPEERKQFMLGRPESKSRLAEAKKAVKKIPGAPPPHPEEVMALQTYTGLFYGPVNAALRGNDADVLAKPLTPAQKTKYLEDAKFASAALDALPNYEGTVYRGAALPKNIISQYQVGKTITEKAFTSTSGKPDVADNFAASGDGAVSVKYTIASKKGKSIKSLSAVPGEEEILFNANTQFKVLANKTKKGITHIYLEEV